MSRRHVFVLVSPKRDPRVFEGAGAKEMAAVAFAVETNPSLLTHLTESVTNEGQTITFRSPTNDVLAIVHLDHVSAKWVMTRFPGGTQRQFFDDQDQAERVAMDWSVAQMARRESSVESVAAA